ncbi:MAG: hypothetical protein IKZ47_02955 [Clostridia bacterium]|nr:hypothetical protein [Clostridia bacterium]
MKKILAIVLCVVIALTLSISAMAESSPENNVIIRKATATKNTGAAIPEDTFVELGDDGTITVVADEAKYGKFIDWSVYVISDVTGTASEFEAGAGSADLLELATTQKATDAKLGTDYTIVAGGLTEKTMTVKPISRIAICGNYYNANNQATKTDPLSASSVAGTVADTSSKTSDLSILYISLVMLAAAAVIFGAKRQLSK